MNRANLAAATFLVAGTLALGGATAYAALDEPDAVPAGQHEGRGERGEDRGLHLGRDHEGRDGGKNGGKNGSKNGGSDNGLHLGRDGAPGQNGTAPGLENKPEKGEKPEKQKDDGREDKPGKGPKTR